MSPVSALPLFRPEAALSLAQASPWKLQPVSLDSPALQVMTDLTQVKAATVAPEQTLAQAEQAMVYLGVRLLFVVTRMPELLGLITSHDLHGERQMRLVHERGLHFDEMRVADVMTPLAALDAVAFERVEHASVAEVVATLQQVGRDHLLVLQAASGSAPQRVRGLISRTQVERQLGQAVAGLGVARSFAEIEQALI